MRSIVEKINENLYTPGTGFDECDGLTREYNNLFGMVSNTLLRKVDTTIIDRPVYVLTGSAVRPGRNFSIDLLLYERIIGTQDGHISPYEFLCERGWHVYDNNGYPIHDRCCADSTCGPAEDKLDSIILSAISDMISDSDYLIIA